MRFVENGPDVPLELIDAQKNGQTVFFCGAGISIPAGLPSFKDLTSKVADTLHATDHKIIRKLIDDEQYDRVFSWLRQNYLSDEVDYHVLKSVRTPRKPALKNHRNLLKLSTNPSGEPLIVTTNFDRLFERAQEGLKHFSAPMLPDLSAGADAYGLVYLHGRWEKTKRQSGKKKQSLIISSQDFGRAYLAHGWAARFLAEILRTRTIVLVGYSGDDTLVRYLLEGLTTETESVPTNIYAFDRGAEGAVKQKWSRLGVNGIACPDYESLWSTIEVWSKSVNEPSYWDEHIHTLSIKSPSQLKPFERGQVSSFISNQKGAEKFSAFDPRPHAEWICVFDRNIRFLTQKVYENESDQVIDYLDLYGTDKDPSRVEIDSYEERDRAYIGEDYLAEAVTSKSQKLPERVSNLNYADVWRISSRVTAICRWISSVVDHPILIWWLLRQNTLHPQILRSISRKEFGAAGRDATKLEKFWHQFTLYHQNRSLDWDRGWFDFHSKIQSKGWHKGIVAEFETFMQPELVPDLTLNSRIPDSNNTHIDHLLPRFEVCFPRIEYMSEDVPDEWAGAMLSVVSRSLAKAVELLKFVEYNATWFRHTEFPQLIADDDTDDFGGQHETIRKMIFFASNLLTQLSNFDPEGVFRIVEDWTEGDPYIFDRLRLFVLRLEVPLTSSASIEQLEKISEEVFWDTAVARELVGALLNLFPSMTEDDRLRVERRLCAFYERSEEDDEDGHQRTKVYQVGRLLSHLNSTDIGLTRFGKQQLEEIRRSEYWEDEFNEDRYPGTGVFGGFVSTNTSIDGLENLEGEELFDEIGRRENDRSEFLKENRPFLGIVINDPDKATRLLVSELDEGRERKKYWQQLFANFPKDASFGNCKALALATLTLPDNLILACGNDLCRWVQTSLPQVLSSKRELFWEVWDYVFQTLSDFGEEATRSAIGEIRRAGRIVSTSRKTLDHALNSPIGILVNAVFSACDEWNLGDETEDFARALDRLASSLKLDGEGGACATALIALRYNYLFAHFPRWTKSNLVPMFAVKNGNSEAAWYGFVGQRTPASKKAFVAIKPELLNVMEAKIDWTADDQFWRRFAHFLVIYAYWSGSKGAYFKDVDVRNAIRLFNEKTRAQAIWFVSKYVRERECWPTFGKRFFAKYWPLEREYQSAKTTNHLLTVAVEAGEYFPEVIETITPLLVPSERDTMFLHRITSVRESGSSIISRWPESVLSVLDRIYPAAMPSEPYNLREALNAIADVSPKFRLHPTWLRLDEVCGA